MENREVLTAEQVAEFTGISVFTIREYAKAGRIPANKIGKSWRFYKPDLVAWVRGKVDPEQEQGR